MSAFRTELKQVRGHGSAREGTHHWWMQRVTAIALVPLSIWFLCFVAASKGADYASIRDSVAQPLTAALMLTYLWAMLHHAYLGLQIVIEDYIHVRALEIGLLVAIRLILILGALTATVAVLRLVFFGAQPS